MASQPPQTVEPAIGSQLLWAGIAAGGLILAMLAVYVGTGLHDGFSDWDLHRLGRRLRRSLPWSLPLAVVAGLLLRGYYLGLLRGSRSGWGMLWSVARAFAHFPFFGMLALLAMMWGFLAAGGRLLPRLWRKAARKPLPPQNEAPVLERWLAVPLWFIMLPFIVLKLPMEGNIAIPQSISLRRLLRWLPAMLALLFLYTDAYSEDSGERVDPYWLTAFAALWLGDYLLAALRLAPVLRARRQDPG